MIRKNMLKNSNEQPKYIEKYSAIMYTNFVRQGIKTDAFFSYF